MSKFRKKPIVIEAITFDELVEHGRNNGANIVDGMPWSWDYNDHPITHENNACYLIPTEEGTMHMTPKDMLITGIQGEIYPCKIDIFESSYESAVESCATKDCESCEGTGRLEIEPDSQITHPCDDCQPEALAEFNRGREAEKALAK